MDDDETDMIESRMYINFKDESKKFKTVGNSRIKCIIAKETQRETDQVKYNITVLIIWNNFQYSSDFIKCTNYFNQMFWIIVFIQFCSNFSFYI